MVRLLLSCGGGFIDAAANSYDDLVWADRNHHDAVVQLLVSHFKSLYTRGEGVGGLGGLMPLDILWS